MTVSLFDVFRDSPARDAAGVTVDYLNRARLASMPEFTQAIQNLQTDYGRAAQPSQSIFDTGTKGLDVYGNALGLGGPQGTARAIQQFQQTPGYQFQLRQGDEAIRAAAEAQGRTGGPEALALQKFGQGLAGTGWQDYLKALQPYFGLSQAGASNLGNIWSGLGNQVANQFDIRGNALYGNLASQGNALANADLARYGASANMWGGLLGGLGMLSGGAGGLTRLGSNLFGSFSGPGSGSYSGVGGWT